MTVLSVSGLLAETIMNVFADDSVSAIFGGENQLSSLRRRAGIRSHGLPIAQIPEGVRFAAASLRGYETGSLHGLPSSFALPTGRQRLGFTSAPPGGALDRSGDDEEEERREHGDGVA